MMDRNKVGSILFITLSNLGDIILTTPVLEKLCDEFPQAAIDVITGAPGKDIFSFHPQVREVIVYNKRPRFSERLNTVIMLRKKRYDLVVDLKRSLIPYLIGAKLHSQLFALQKIMHKKDEHLSTLYNLISEPFSNNRFFIPVQEEEKNFISRIINFNDNKRIVVISPGAKSHLKRWTAQKYAALADRLIRELNAKVILIGNEDDKEIIEIVKGYMKEDPINLCCKTSMGQLAELMKHADLVITNDSAPLHVASAVNAATLAIFGPSDDRKYGPLSKKSSVIVPRVSCRPCEKALCDIGPDEGCLMQVEVEEVFEVARRILSSESRDRSKNGDCPPPDFKLTTGGLSPK